VSKKTNQKNQTPKVNETPEHQDSHLKTKATDGLQLYRVDWDFDTESDKGERVLQHVYTYIVVEPNRIGKISEEWHPDALHLTFRMISGTPEEDAYRAGMEEGYNMAMDFVNQQTAVEVEEPGPNQPTLFDE
jgi:hypothetical protein